MKQVVFNNGMFMIQQILQPIGKVFESKIPSKKTLNSIKSIITEEKKDGQTFTMLQQRVMDTMDKPEIQATYEKELNKLIKKAQKASTTKIYLGKGKSVRFRVIGYKNGFSILEPADARNGNLIDKLGYYEEQKVEE